MRHRITTIAAGTLLAWALAAPRPALADGELPSLVSLEQRLLALEDQLAASESTIAAQRELLRAANVTGGALGQAGGGGSFWDNLNIGGHLAASYLYNFNAADAGATGSQPLCQFNCNQNEFKVDAVKLEIGKPTDGPGTAGFQFDLLYGQNADISRFLSPTALGGVNGDDDFSVFVQQAYVVYDWNGTEVKFGNFETLLGWELIDSNDNANVTHGILFTWTIPLYHTGIMLGGSLSEKVSWNLGVTNGFNNTVDSNDNKGVLGLISYEDGGFFTSLSGYYGEDFAEGSAGQPGSADSQYILDFVASLDASEDVSLWLNADYGEQEDGDPLGGDADWWGVAVGAKFDLTEKASLALRGEYFEDDDNVRGIAGASTDFEAFSLTGTFAYQLTENLLLRTELRYDEADDDGSALVIPRPDGDIFPDDSSAGFDDSALYGIVELNYAFD